MRERQTDRQTETERNKETKKERGREYSTTDLSINLRDGAPVVLLVRCHPRIRRARLGRCNIGNVHTVKRNDGEKRAGGSNCSQNQIFNLINKELFVVHPRHIGDGLD